MSIFLYTIRPFEYPIFVYFPNRSGLFSSVKPVELRDNWVQHWSKNNKFDDLMLKARYTWFINDTRLNLKNFKVIYQHMCRMNTIVLRHRILVTVRFLHPHFSLHILQSNEWKGKSEGNHIAYYYRHSIKRSYYLPWQWPLGMHTDPDLHVPWVIPLPFKPPLMPHA